MVFAVARKAGFLPDDVSAEHVGFGQVLGADGKKFSTREGTAVTLNSLLDAAEPEAAPPVALAAIKYADLSNGLNKDYVFDVERMVQTTGNTGPYLQYAHARVNQMLRKAAARGYGEQSKVLVLEEPAEQTLALLLTRFGDVVAEVAGPCSPTACAATSTSWPARWHLLRAVPRAPVLRRGARLAARVVLGDEAGARLRSHHARHRAA